MRPQAVVDAPAWLVDLVAAIEVGPGPLVLDPWAPSVQGAVGHVAGVRGADGTAYVLKVYGRNARRQALTEVLALGLLAEVDGIRVPRVLHHRERAAGTPRAHVLMTRLPGVRWADRRAALDHRTSMALHREVGRLLRRMHVVAHEQFGGLLPDGRRWSTAWSQMDARCDELVQRYASSGGPVDLCRRVRGLVDDYRVELDSCTQPVLCHHDFIDGNLLVSPTGPPHVTGVVDLERASWDDPLTDLARTRLHARFHDEAGADALVKAYGLRSEDEERRVAVHEVLHAVEERAWVASDRPFGWRQSVAGHDAFVRART